MYNFFKILYPLLNHNNTETSADQNSVDQNSVDSQFSIHMVNPYSNALAFVTRPLIVLHQQFATVYPCDVTFHWMTCGFMRFATLQI